MIQLTEIAVRGESSAGPFEGRLTFEPGLQLISAPNSFGKSLAVKTVAWCLGAEAIFGRPANDPSLFPRAVREEIDLAGAPKQRVVSSVCTIAFRRDDGARLSLSRDILGQPEHVRVEELSVDGATRRSTLNARLQTMQDEHGGLQRFLFEWLGWPRKSVTTYNNTSAEVYLENLIPLFYIEQIHGWSGLQATQISRYRQQQIDAVAVEYLLGATAAVDARFARNRAQLQDNALRDRAKDVARRANDIFLKYGWAIDWSGDGSLRHVVARWSAHTLRESLLSSADVDLNKERGFLVDKLVAVRRKLTGDPLDPDLISAPTGVSQLAIDLKQQRHRLNGELRTLRMQQVEARDLLDSLDHRLQAARDVYRFKTTGVGRLTVMECPTCHRDIDLKAFELELQSKESVGVHIEALRRDRDLIRKNVESLEETITRASTEASRVEADFRDAERALEAVNLAIGTTREQLTAAAAQVTATEKAIGRVDDARDGLDELQTAVDKWLEEARAVQQIDAVPSDLPERVVVFTTALRFFLIALGHSAVNAQNAHAIRLDDRYEPYLEEVELKGMGSASDGPRLVSAYSLALATASAKKRGLHPGLVLLDEPLQQNPDDPHRRLFLDSLVKEHQRRSEKTEPTYQILIFTSLYPNEIERLQSVNFPVQTPDKDGDRFLRRPVPPADAPIAADDLEAAAAPEGSAGKEEAEAQEESQDKPSS